MLSLVLLLSATEKSATLASGRQRWHPVILASPLLRRSATLALWLGLAADVAAAIGVVISRWGTAAVASLVVVYSIAGSRAHFGDTGGCRCLWKIFDARTRRALFGRNALFLVLAAVASAPREFDPGPLALFGVGALALVGLTVRSLNQHRASPASRPAQTVSERPQEV